MQKLITAEQLAELRRTPWVTARTMARVLGVPAKRVVRWAWDHKNSGLRVGKLPGGNDWLISTTDIPEGWAFPRQGPKMREDPAALAAVRAMIRRGGGPREAWAALEQALGWDYWKMRRWRQRIEKEARDGTDRSTGSGIQSGEDASDSER